MDKTKREIIKEIINANNKRLKILKIAAKNKENWISDKYIKELSTEDYVSNELRRAGELSFKEEEDIRDLARNSYDEIMLPTHRELKFFIIPVTTAESDDAIIEINTQSIKSIIDPDQKAEILKISEFALNRELYPLHKRSDYGNYLTKRFYEASISNNYEYLTPYPTEKTYLNNKEYFILGYTSNIDALKKDAFGPEDECQNILKIGEYAKQTYFQIYKKIYESYIERKPNVKYKITIETSSSEMKQQDNNDAECFFVISSKGEEDLFSRPTTDMHTLVSSVIVLQEILKEVEVEVIGHEKRTKRYSSQDFIKRVTETNEFNLNFLFRKTQLLSFEK